MCVKIKSKIAAGHNIIKLNVSEQANEYDYEYSVYLFLFLYSTQSVSENDSQVRQQAC